MGAATLSKETHRPTNAVEMLFDGIDIATEDLAPAREAASILFEALWSEYGLKPDGIATVFLQQRQAVERLGQIEADRRRYPEIARENIMAPLILAGAPRSGTTFLHSLMSQDPAFRSPLAWETLYPSPPPEAATYSTDPRIDRWKHDNYGEDAASSNKAGNAEFAKKHLMAATLPEECGKMLSSSVRNMDVWALARVIPYFNWFLDTDKQPAFAVHRKWLQHLQWRNPRERWLLKYPSHGLMWPYVFQSFPDAIVVETHRNPCATISSLASLIGTLRKLAFENQDPFALGIEMMHFQQANYLRPIAFRQSNPQKTFIDVSYNDLLTEPLETVRRVYAAAGLTLSVEAERRMRQFVLDNPQGKHGVHEHDLESYGLNEAILREKLAPYYERYGDMIG